jgi:serine/threonine protein kinase
MELLEGQTLAQLIGRQPFPTDRLLPMAIQIADALESVHAKGIDSILNREPRPADQANPAVPAEFGRVLSKLLEKDRNLRCQTATELKTDLNRLKRDLDSGNKRAAEMTESKSGASKQAVKSVAVLYFENLSGVKEDEYLRDGITEDIITELSKIRGLNTFSRPTVLGPTATSW